MHIQHIGNLRDNVIAESSGATCNIGMLNSVSVLFKEIHRCRWVCRVDENQQTILCTCKRPGNEDIRIVLPSGENRSVDTKRSILGQPFRDGNTGVVSCFAAQTNRGNSSGVGDLLFDLSIDSLSSACNDDMAEILSLSAAICLALSALLDTRKMGELLRYV